MSGFQAWVQRMLWRASFGGITELQIGRENGAITGSGRVRFEALLLGPVHPFTHTSPTKREVFDVLPPERAVVGTLVGVHAFGHWYTGKVLKVTPRRVTVQYTNRSGVTRTKTVPMDSGLVR